MLWIRSSLLSLVLIFVLITFFYTGELKDAHAQVLLWDADQYDFAIVLPAGDLQCFWHFAENDQWFYLNFMVLLVTGVGLDRHLSVIINAPSGLIVSNVDDARGQITLKTAETGHYQICFSNFHNRFGSMQVSLNFGVYNKEPGDRQENTKQTEAEKMKKDDDMKQINSSLSTIVEGASRLQRLVFHMRRHYSLEHMRTDSHYYQLQSNSSYVTSWSAAQSFIIITAGLLQLFFLKRLFKAPPQEGDKPTC